MRVRGAERIGDPGGGRGLRSPSRWARLAIPILVLVVLAAGLCRYCFVYVAPNEVGIKEVRIGWNRGIHSNLYSPGYAFRIPFGFAYVHTFPKNVQVLELTGYGDVVEETDSHQYEPSVKIQTSDGYFVDVDVTILYRIEDPYKVITTLGPGDRFLSMGILPRTVPNLKQAFGELTTEDFYNSPLRVRQGDVALGLMNKDLNEKGIAVDQVLVRYFQYSPEIQQNIEDKKLKDQLVFTNQSKNKAAQAEAEFKRVTQEGEANVLVTHELGQAYKVQKEAERDLYTRKKRAEADLLVQLAEAKRAEYRNTAMQVAGSDRAVAMKMAEVLSGLDVVMVPTGGPEGLNPLDLQQVSTMFGVTPGSELHTTAAAAPPLAAPEPEPVSAPAPPVEPVPAFTPAAESEAPTTTEVPSDDVR